jgi:hypothetical protein
MYVRLVQFFLPTGEEQISPLDPRVKKPPTNIIFENEQLLLIIFHKTYSEMASCHSTVCSNVNFMEMYINLLF